MRDALLFSAGLLVVSLSFGFLTAPGVYRPDAAAYGAFAPPQLVHPGRQLAQAALRLKTLAPEPVIAEPPPPAAPAGPPPIDIAEQFRRELSAVLGSDRAAVLVMVNVAQPGTRRSLRRGDSYRDGWKVQDVGAQDVILRRNGETRHVRIAGAYPAGVSPGEFASETGADQPTAGERAPGRQRLQLSRKAAKGGTW